MVKKNFSFVSRYKPYLGGISITRDVIQEVIQTSEQSMLIEEEGELAPNPKMLTSFTHENELLPVNKTPSTKLLVEESQQFKKYHNTISKNILNNDLEDELIDLRQARDNQTSISNQPSKEPDVLKGLCTSLGYTLYEEQRLPYDAAYEPLGVISTEIKPSQSTLDRLRRAKEERDHQNLSFLEAAIHELTDKGRAETLISLLSPPGRFQGGNKSSLMKASWASFITRIKIAISQAISKDEAILMAATQAGEVPFPSNILQDSIEVAKEGGKVENLIKTYRAKVSEGGLSRQSILRTLGENHPQVPLLLDIIENGAKLIPSPEFKPIIYPSPARNLEIKLGHAVLKAYLDLHKEFKEIIIDPRVLDPSIFNQKSFVDNHWTTKVEKGGKIVPTGRIAIDPSNPPPGVEPLNGEIQKLNATSLYGQPKTPLFSDMIRELLIMCEEHGIPTSEVKIAKGDVAPRCIHQVSLGH